MHQLRQTLNAYLPSYIYVGEALQNALDATRDAGGGGRIDVELDLPAQRVSVHDQGVGFPNEPRLLYLGGGNKHGKGYGGLIGVGLKVILFSSADFELRARSDDATLRCHLIDADLFDATPKPTLEVPQLGFPSDTDPLTHPGTQLTYTFRSETQSAQKQFLQILSDEISARSFEEFYGQTLANAVTAKAYPNRFAALLALYLKRFSYLGLTTVPKELAQTVVAFKIKADPAALPGKLPSLLDGQTEFEFETRPGYTSVEDTVAWAPTTRRRPLLSDKPLLNGGRGLNRTDLGFNSTSYSTEAQYISLLTDVRGKVSIPEERLTSYKTRLFPRLQSVRLTIGRIPEFERYLPGGPKHVLSANGVVTSHAVEFNRGQNQQYIRCFDIVVDVNAELNYGKTQLNDMRLVGLYRQFLNDVYAATVQHAARDFVGKMKDIHEDTNDEFFSRPDLGGQLTQKKVPRSENDVIALTFELAGRGFLKDYRWFGLSSKDTYDSRAIIRRSGDPEGYLDSLGESKLRVVEFKLRAGSIARDFMQQSKDPRKVDLLIAYELGEVGAAAEEFQLLTVEASPTYGGSPEKVYPGVNHVMYDASSGAEVQILLIRDLLSEVFPEPPPAGQLQDDVDEDD